MAQPEHFDKIEQQLFEVHAQLEVASTEFELLCRQALLAQQALEAAGDRAAVAETPLAEIEHSEARRRVREFDRRRQAAEQELDRLKAQKDALLAKLVG